MTEGGMFFGGEDLPPELVQLLQGLTRRTFDSGMAHDPADKFMPSEAQKAIVPGDRCAVTSSREEDEFTIALVLDPEEHAETFPDWEERVKFQSYILANVFTPTELGGTLGWLPRTRLVPLESEAQWDQMLRWARGIEETKGPPPEWLTRLYNKTLYGMALANPEHMALPVKCPECDSVSVVITVVHHHRNSYCMGNKPGEHEQGVRADALYVVTPYRENHTTVAELDCIDCKYHEQLPEEQELLRDWS